MIFTSVLAAMFMVQSDFAIKLMKNSETIIYKSQNALSDQGMLSKPLDNSTVTDLHYSTCALKSVEVLIIEPLLILPFIFRAIKLVSIFSQLKEYTD